MSRTKLISLKLEAFRGASQPVLLEFEGDKHLSMIYGENGTGKSSIVDALSFLGERNFGSLHDHSEADTDRIAAVSAASLDAVKVTLETDSGVWAASFAPKTKTIVVKPEKSAPTVCVLRRRRILDLIDAQPKERYGVLAKYIDLPSVTKSETAINEALLKTAKPEALDSRQRLIQAEEALKMLWERQGKQEANAKVWAEKECAGDLSGVSTSLAAVEKVINSITELKRRAEEWEKAKKEAEDAEKGEKTARQELEDAEKKASGESGSLLGLLEEAKQFVDRDTTLSSCPVCEQAVARTDLSTRLTDRIAGMKELGERLKTLRAAEQVKVGKYSSLTERAERLAFQSKTLGVALVTPAWPADAGSAPAASISAVLSETDSADGASLSKVVGHIADLEAVSAALVAQSEKWKAAVTLRGTIEDHLKTLNKYAEKAIQSNALVELIEKAHKALIEERKKYVESELNSISAEVAALYAKLHPGEALGGIKFGLKEKARGSLFLTGDFHSEKEVKPENLYSESHLDTLGLCVFMAMAKKYHPKGTIVVLDDVVSSVDHKHLDRLIDLLHEEAANFGHIVITTHYRPWLERYRFNRAPAGKLHFIELGEWNLEEGIVPYKSKLAVAELRAALGQKPMDRQSVASKAGILLESQLEFLVRTYERPMPLRGGGYALRELLDGLSGKKLMPLLRTELDTPGATQTDPPVTKSTPLAPLVERAKGLAAVRNQVGAHYNELGAYCSEAEIKELGQLALEFAEALVCPEGGDLPSRNKTGSNWQTRSGKVRLFPLEEP